MIISCKEVHQYLGLSRTEWKSLRKNLKIANYNNTVILDEIRNIFKKHGYNKVFENPELVEGYFLEEIN